MFARTVASRLLPAHSFYRFLAVGLFVFTSASVSAVRIAGTSFENEISRRGPYINPAADGRPAGTQSVDLTNQADDPATPKRDETVIVNSTVEDELGYEARWVDSRDAAGLADGADIGVYGDTGLVPPYPHGRNAYRLSDTQGKLILSFDTVDVAAYRDVSVALDLCVIDHNHESGDTIAVTVTADGADREVLRLHGTDGKAESGADDNPELEARKGVWTTVRSDLPAGTREVSLSVSCDTNARAEGVYIDNVRIEGEPAGAARQGGTVPSAEEKAVVNSSEVPGPRTTREIINPLDIGDVDLMVHAHHTSHLPSSISRNAVRWRRADETLVPTTGDDFADIVAMTRMMAANGVDGIMIRAHMTAMEAFLKAAEASGTDVGIAALYNLGALGTAGRDANGWEYLHDKAREMLDVYGDHPNLYRQDGKVVIYVYRAGSGLISAEGYGKVRKSLSEAGYNVLMLGAFHAHKVARRADPVGYLKPFAEHMGFFTWASELEPKRQNQKTFLAASAEAGQQAFHATVSPGKWRPELGHWIPQHGTKAFRRHLRLALSGRPQVINFESWDDLSELEHLEPTMENPGVLLDLAAFMTGTQTGASWPPRLYLSYPREILVGQVLEIEVLGLPSPHDVELSLTLEDASGTVLLRYPAETIRRAQSEALTFHFPTAGCSQRNAIFPVLTARGNGEERRYEGAGYIRLRGSRRHNHYQRHVALHRLAPVDNVTLNVVGGASGAEVIGGDRRQVELSVKSPATLQRVELIKNNLLPVYGYDARGQVDADKKRLAVTWRCGAPGIKAESYNYSGSLTVSQGRILRANIVRSAWDEPSELPVSGRTTRWENTNRENRVELLLEAADDVTATLAFPGYGKEFAFSWNDLTTGPFLEFRLSNRSLVKVESLEGPIGLPAAIGETTVRDEFTLSRQPGEPPVTSYYVRILDEQGRLYRSRPVWVRHAAGSSVEFVRIWDADNRRMARVPMWTDDIAASVWPLDEGKGRRGFDRGNSYALPHSGMGGWRLAAELGGTVLRTGGYAGDGEPSWVKTDAGTALRFDGDDRLYLPPRAIPLGEMTFEMVVRPEAQQEQAMLLSADWHYWVWLTSKGHVGVRRFTGKGGESRELMSDRILETGQWAHLAVVNTLRELRLYLNGEPIAATALPLPPRDQEPHPARIGARQRRLAKFKDGFRGDIESIALTGRALKPAVFQLLERLP